MRIGQLNWFEVESCLENDDCYEWVVQRGSARRLLFTGFFI